MDAVMFSLKRAFHKSIEAGLRLTRVFGLTPARFDMLSALLVPGTDVPVRQSELRGLLGVSAPTVSRMVTSLERLGLVARLRDERGRSRGVMLTEAGKRCIARARHALLERGAASRMVSAFWRRSPFDNARAAMNQNRATVLQFTLLLQRMRRGLMDWAWLDYPLYVSKARLKCHGSLAR